MKIPLKRFKNVADVNHVEDAQLDNGNYTTISTKRFTFIFAYINDTISEKLSNLGTNETNNRLIASHDTRFEKYLSEAEIKDQININGKSYLIKNVSKDDSGIDPLYEISLTLPDGY